MHFYKSIFQKSSMSPYNFIKIFLLTHKEIEFLYFKLMIGVPMEI